jgi:dTMP kinase
VPLLFRPQPGPGTLIAVEGLDGSGKTTVVRLLAGQLAAAGVPVLTTRLPTSEMRESRFFQLLRNQGRTDLVDPVAFEVEYMVDRIQHCRAVIEPALRAGTTVITDRYAFSSVGTLLFRLPELRRVVLAAVQADAWFADLCRHLIRPDLTLVLTADGRTGRDRLRSRPGEDDVDFAPADYDELQQLLLRLATDSGAVPVDSTGPAPATVAACRPHLDRLDRLGPAAPAVSAPSAAPAAPAGAAGPAGGRA